MHKQLVLHKVFSAIPCLIPVAYLYNKAVAALKWDSRVTVYQEKYAAESFTAVIAIIGFYIDLG